MFLLLYIAYFVYLYIILFIICVLSYCCLSVALWSFCHYNKFLVCVNIPGDKAHSDSDSDKMWMKNLGKTRVLRDWLWQLSLTHSGCLWYLFQESHRKVRNRYAKIIIRPSVCVCQSGLCECMYIFLEDIGYSISIGTCVHSCVYVLMLCVCVCVCICVLACYPYVFSMDRSGRRA